jgi:hypothetical protein
MVATYAEESNIGCYSSQVWNQTIMSWYIMGSKPTFLGKENYKPHQKIVHMVHKSLHD